MKTLGPLGVGGHVRAVARLSDPKGSRGIPHPRGPGLSATEKGPGDEGEVEEVE
jgi:hypothetical protein